jgi:hypothetical protein
MKMVSGELNTMINYTVRKKSRYSQSNNSSQYNMARTFSQDAIPTKRQPSPRLKSLGKREDSN